MQDSCPFPPLGLDPTAPLLQRQLTAAGSLEGLVGEVTNDGGENTGWSAVSALGRVARSPEEEEAEVLEVGDDADCGC